jgi:hypothetical protein
LLLAVVLPRSARTRWIDTLAAIWPALVLSPWTATRTKPEVGRSMVKLASPARYCSTSGTAKEV